MEACKKITLRQGCALVVSMVFSPAVRLFAAYGGGKANQSGWIAPLAAALVLILFLFLLRPLFKTGKSLSRLVFFHCGAVGGRIVSAVYFLWGIAVTSMHFCYYAGRLVETVYPDTAPMLFIVLMAVLCVWALYKGINPVARLNEILLPLILAVSGLLLLLLTRTVEWQNLFPIDDAASLRHVALCDLASFGYVTLLLFFNDEIFPEKHFWRRALPYTLTVGLISTWVLITVLGNLGPYLLEELPYPFLAAVKKISVGEFLQHIEAFVVTLWIMADFILLAVLGKATIKNGQALFGVKNDKKLILPVYAVCVLLTPLWGSGERMRYLSQNWFVPLNLVLLYLLPALLLVCEKVHPSKAHLSADSHCP